MALRVQVLRCFLLATTAGALLLIGWFWHLPSLIGSGFAWLAMLPWLYRRDRLDWRGAMTLGFAGLLGFGIGFWGVMSLIFRFVTCAASLALAGYFLRTLFPPHVALITAIGEASRGPLGPQLRAYTRWITWFWGLFLLLAGLMSLGQLIGLQFLVRLTWLSSGQLPLAVVLFIGEFYLRKLLFPAHNHPGFRAYLTIVASAMAHPPRTR